MQPQPRSESQRYQKADSGRTRTDALDCLTAEHALIADYLGNLREATARMAAGACPPAEFFEQAILVACQFVDTYHHDKEDRQLFALLARKHADVVGRRLDTLAYDHGRGRELVASIQRDLDDYRDGRLDAIARVRENLGAFATMLAEHVRHEDEELFPLVRETLTEEESQELLVQFGRTDERAGVAFFEESRGRIAKMAELLRALADSTTGGPDHE